MTSSSSTGAAGARDRAIVETVERFWQVTASQLRRLHFADGSETSRAIRQRRTLARLVRDERLRRLPRPVGGGDGGSGGYVYLPATSRTRVEVAHTLDVTELYVRLVEAERASALTVLGVAPEPYCHVHLADTVLKPDCSLRIRTTCGTFRYFIEVDRGTEWRPQLRAKMRGYERGYERWPEPTFPKVVFVVHDDLRRAFIAAMTARTTHPELFAVVRFDTAIATLASAP
jgi:hypothetical protein